MRFFISIFVFLAFTVVGSSSFAADHIRVVLDTSISMKGYTNSKGETIKGEDPGKLSILSVKLLTDLLYPIVQNSEGDTYEVHTFEEKYDNWPTSGLPPPSSGYKKISLNNKASSWTDFQSDLNSIVRNSKVTFFYPSIKAAFESLPSLKAKDDNDSLTIILITDGESDSKYSKYGGSSAKYEEEKKALQKLAGRMDERAVRLYILAFGNAKDDIFFNAMTTSDSGNSIGRFIKVNDTKNLIAAMSDIFSERFGYELIPDSSSIPPYDTINNPKILKKLKGEGEQKFVGVLSTINTPDIPSFKLEKSAGAKSVNIYNDYHSGNKIIGEDLSKNIGGGYYLKWLDNPEGDYKFVPQSPVPQDVLIFRPLSVEVGVGGVGAANETLMNNSEIDLEVMAGVREDVFFYTKTPGISGKGGIPKNRDLSVQYGIRGDWLNKDNTYAGKNDGKLQVASEVSPDPEKFGARWFHEEIEFEEKNKSDKAEVYKARLPVRAKLKQRIIGMAIDRNSRRVSVYPRMGFSPIGETSQNNHIQLRREDNSNTPLKQGEVACSTFRLEKKHGFYNKFNDSISLKAYLEDSSSNPSTLNHAAFTLDGKSLNNPSNSGKTNLYISYYKKNEKRTVLDQLQHGNTSKNGNDEYSYKLCVKIGVPKRGGEVKLKLNLIIDKEPYRRIDNVISPLYVSFNVESPNWQWWYPLLLLLLVLWWWLLRFVPKLEDDLKYTYYKEGSEPPKVADSLVAFSEANPVLKLICRLIHKPCTKEINNLTTQAVIGKIRPLEKGLYEVYFNANNELKCIKEKEYLKSKQGWVSIHVNVSYNLILDGEAFIFRVEYE